jgi:hypothetical protein
VGPAQDRPVIFGQPLKILTVSKPAVIRCRAAVNHWPSTQHLEEERKRLLPRWNLIYFSIYLYRSLTSLCSYSGGFVLITGQTRPLEEERKRLLPRWNLIYFSIYLYRSPTSLRSYSGGFVLITSQTRPLGGGENMFTVAIVINF